MYDSVQTATNNWLVSDAGRRLAGRVQLEAAVNESQIAVLVGIKADSPNHGWPQQWRGHAFGTRETLQAILERAAMGHREFSVEERVLYMACEFWAAVCNQTLPAHLRSDTARELRRMAIIYATIGAAELARWLNAGAGVWRRKRGPIARNRYLHALQKQLRNTSDVVDHLIEQFADTIVCTVPTSHWVGIRGSHHPQAVHPLAGDCVDSRFNLAHRNGVTRS
jgi:hypothetical protein